MTTKSAGRSSAKDINRAAAPFAVVTGASTGIGLELARQCAAHGYDLLIVADEPEIEGAASCSSNPAGRSRRWRPISPRPKAWTACWSAASGRPIDALLANAGRGLGRAFIDQDFNEVRRVIDTNVTGTVYLLHKVAREMKDRGHGRILITGSIAGFMPGTFQAVYNGTKAFLDSFSFALRAELKGSGVTVTCLMPGATETDFFECADMLDTKVGTAKKDDPAEVARTGFDAMMKGDGDVVSGWQNKLQAAIAGVLPAGFTAELHRKQAAPGTANKK
jgi:uncharacterized protein